MISETQAGAADDLQAELASVSRILERQPTDRAALHHLEEARPTGAIDVAPLIGDFADTASLLVGLDLLVTVDTSICHLAGAMGVPTILLLPRRIDWRWIPGDGATGWYPAAIMVRQDPSGPVARVRERLAARA